MEQQEINVYEILKDMPMGTKLYSPICGRTVLFDLDEEIEERCGTSIVTKNDEEEFSFYKNGRYTDEGEVMLFPSNEMRDWSKFFKKGDIIESNVDGKHLIGVFDCWESDSLYARFWAKYVRDDNGEWFKLGCSTSDWYGADWSTAREFIGNIEREYDGRLNLETLEIEKKPAYNFKTFDKVLVRDEEGKKWLPAIYLKNVDNSVNSRMYSHKVFDFNQECVNYYNYCIPFEKHEHLAYTSDPEDTLPF